MYKLTQEVITGINIVAALQGEHNMPGIADIERELNYLAKYVADSEKYYGVAFKKSEVKKDDQFDVVSDTKAHFEEFYFGGQRDLEFGYRPQPVFRLVMEPLLESMLELSHDEILDSFGNIVDQLKEFLVIADHNRKLDSAVAYTLYRKMIMDKVKAKKIKEATEGVMRLRKKSLALRHEINKSRA